MYRMDRQEKKALINKLRNDAQVIADHFDLDFKMIRAERANVKNRYGACTSDGVITIRLWNIKTNRPLRYSSLIDTLCHELAHLRHFNHGPAFKTFYIEILSWARKQGIYRPKGAKAPNNHQAIQAAKEAITRLELELGVMRENIKNHPHLKVVVPERSDDMAFIEDDLLQFDETLESEQKGQLNLLSWQAPTGQTKTRRRRKPQAKVKSVSVQLSLFS